LRPEAASVDTRSALDGVITRDQLAVEIERYKDDEFRGEVEAVYRDSDGRRFLPFNAPGGGVQRYYLEENGCCLEGNVLEVLAEED
jgi:hypothetical protein